VIGQTRFHCRSAAQRLVSPLRFLAGFFMATIYHANRAWKKSFFKVDRYMKTAWLVRATA
jgi:hypothetical protein